MKFLLVSLFFSIATMLASRAQDCLGISLKQGSGFEMLNYNAKDKPIGKVKYQVTSVSKENGATIVNIQAQMEDDKGKQQPPYTIKYTCTGNELIADMSGLFQSMQQSNLKNSEMKLKANQLVYPGKLSPGQKLADGTMEAEMTTNGSMTMTMVMNITNRLVDGKESITTPAGTFDAYKVTSDMNTESRIMGMPIRATMKTVSYRANNQIFDVKTETYNKSGKLMGYSVLSKVM
ncbi:hypothetical protein [Spirosoma sp. KUDC1026]|uniref:TapB family protein n=1 Tax=Spirosoma sp. KUDC1026 TaxID=2745947 RepID=UPI00159B8A0A|nr:hypothetical protein [Spirosoma sp. KUDC1026]QKZ12266.1 hypothetical protein HU175_06345 [Spirosoma sp. KUDC1026]